MMIDDLEEKTAKIYTQANAVVEFLKPLVMGYVIGLVIFAIQMYFLIRAWVV